MSKIEWLCRPGTKPESWNPVTGCTKVSEGCRNCYAETIANRFWEAQYPPVDIVEYDPTICSYVNEKRYRRFADVQYHEDRLAIPMSWKKPRTVFVNSMSDLFHADVPDEFIDRVFAVMALCPQHTFIVLTKRPERMLEYLIARSKSAQPWKDGARAVGYALDYEGISLVPFPLPNVYLGVSVEDQRTADERIPLLLQTPAAVRVVSAEPLLGPINFDNGTTSWFSCRSQMTEADADAIEASGRDGGFDCCESFSAGLGHFRGIDWLIGGGESGPKARPCDVAWIRSLVSQAKAANVPVFVKQIGANPTCCGTGESVVVFGSRNRKGAEPAEWPDDLRVREWPG